MWEKMSVQELNKFLENRDKFINLDPSVTCKNLSLINVIIGNIANQGYCKNFLESFVAALIGASLLKMPVSLWKKITQYHDPSGVYHPYFDYRGSMRVIDAMLSMNLITQVVGKKSNMKKESFKTRCFPTDEFKNRIKGVSSMIKKRHRFNETIIRNHDGTMSRQDKFDLKNSNRMMRFYNSILHKNKFELSFSDQEISKIYNDFIDSRYGNDYNIKIILGDGLVDEMGKILIRLIERYSHVLSVAPRSGYVKKKGISWNLTDLICYQRVFHDNMKYSGRFYSDVPQKIGGNFRFGLKINEEKTIELDFQGCAPRILYHLSKIDYRKDPYIIYKNQSSRMRELCKKVFARLANGKSEQKLIKSTLEDEELEMFDFKEKEVERCFEVFQKYHRKIANYFLQDGDSWKISTHPESWIALDICYALSRQGIAVLSIHDSFIVQERHRDLLEQTMRECYYKRLKFYPVIKQNF